MLTLSTNIHEARLDGCLAKLPDDLARIVDLGLGGAEIAIHGLDAIRGGALDRRRVDAFLAVAADFPLRLSVHAPDALDAMARRDRDIHLAILDSCLEFCVQARADVLVVHPGRWVTESDFGVLPPWRPDEAEAADLRAEEAEAIARAADRAPDVVVALENARPYLPYSSYTYAEYPDRLLEQVERIGRPNVGVCLDTGHLHMASRLHGFPEAEAVRRLSPWIRHLHVHDNFGRTGYWTEKAQTRQVPLGRGDLHMPPGLGDIDFDAVLGSLLPGFEGIAVCEVRERYLHGMAEHVAVFRALMERLAGRISPDAREPRTPRPELEGA